MSLSDDILLLSNIKKKHLYRDNKSKESTTPIQKPKYKLAGNKDELLDNYFFTILTKNKEACGHKTTVRIGQKDWDQKVDNDEYLCLEYSYCDLMKFERIERDDLLKKMRDKNNGFPYIARLCEAKYKEMQKIRHKIHYFPYIPTAKKNAIDEGMADLHEEKLMQLGLK